LILWQFYLLALGSGLYYSVEAAANLCYWWNDNHPWYFQVGRLVRLILGIILVIVGAIGLW